MGQGSRETVLSFFRMAPCAESSTLGGRDEQSRSEGIHSIMWRALNAARWNGDGVYLWHRRADALLARGYRVGAPNGALAAKRGYTARRGLNSRRRPQVGETRITMFSGRV